MKSLSSNWALTRSRIPNLASMAARDSWYNRVSVEPAGSIRFIIPFNVVS